ncbi:galectin-8-like isoform X2 [Mercenaria mercenaria]|uniref:galectin-8-like isoform X2 n=1 Tax=Mercenaria mercenaria TaxID=6596 RepID=UPI00234EBB90|nr:galectin-8-like isoform X2 [Mercenaria mercenaria]
MRVIAAPTEENIAKMANKNQLPTASGGQHLGSTPIYNPTVPFVYKNLKSVVPGKIFYISGIPFQIPKRNVIVRNTYTWLDNRWGQEERTLNGQFPFKEDKFFEILILIDSASFKVAVNNQPILEFMHRVPFCRIDSLHITGDVRLCQVGP